jgi:hypothetical protein
MPNASARLPSAAVRPGFTTVLEGAATAMAPTAVAAEVAIASANFASGVSARRSD